MAASDERPGHRELLLPYLITNSLVEMQDITPFLCCKLLIAKILCIY